MFRHKQSPLLQSKRLVIRIVFLCIMLAIVLVSVNGAEAATATKHDGKTLFSGDTLVS